MLRSLSLAFLVLASSAAFGQAPPHADGPGSVAQSDAGFYLEPVSAEGGLFYPTDVAVAPGGRFYVTEKTGRVRVVEADGTVRPAPFLDLTAEVETAGDRGLLGIALDPAFPSAPYVYLYLTALDETTRETHDPRFAVVRVVRYRAADGDLGRADPDSRRVLLGEGYDDGVPVCYPFHAGGGIAFGPDGSLFLSTGDAATPEDADAGGRLPDCFAPGRADPADDVGAFRAQRLASPNGKVLRIDPATGRGLPDNPFYTGDPDDVASMVWALGLRNPFRFALAPDDGRGPRLIIGDVGWAKWEDLEVSTGGENFGWPCFEGTEPSGPYAAVAPPEYDCGGPFAGELTFPAATWNHYSPGASAPPGQTANSITGGAFYTGTAYPEPYRGAYFLADYAARWVMAAQIDGRRVTGAEVIAEDAGQFVDVEMDPLADALVLVDLLNGRLVRLRHTGGGRRSRRPASSGRAGGPRSRPSSGAASPSTPTAGPCRSSGRSATGPRPTWPTPPTCTRRQAGTSLR